MCKHILWRPASPNLSEPGPLAGQNLPLMPRVALFPPSMSDFLSLFCGWSPPFFSKCFPVYFFPSVPRPHTQVEVFSQMKGRHDWGRWPFSLHGKELSGNCYPAAGRPGSQGGSPWARGPAVKGRLVPHPPSQPVFQSAVSPSLTSYFLSPRLLKSPPFFTYLFLCPSFLGSSPSSFKVLVWVPRILPKPLAGLRVGGFCYEGQRPHHKPLLGFREGENHGRPDPSSAIWAPLVPHF